MVRITGGIFRSRLLVAPTGSTTRPSSDRLREALFGLLMHRGLVPSGGRALDLYAGTGALGLESLSRGLGHVTFVERASRAIAALRTNVTALDLQTCVRIIERPVERALQSGLLDGETFDLVFADPPYARTSSSGFRNALTALVARRLVTNRTCVVVEHPTKDAPPDLPLTRWESRHYGDSALAFYSMGP